MSALARQIVARLFPPGPGWLVPVMAQGLPGLGRVLALSLAAAALGLAAPMVTKAVIDRGIMARDTGALVFWAGAAFALGLGALGLGVLSAMVHLRASMALLGALRLRVLEAAFRRDPQAPPMVLGEAQTRIDGDSAEIQKFLFDSVLAAVTSVFRLAGGIGLMLALDWRLALLPALAAPLELWFLARARPRTRALTEVVREQRGALNGQLTESVMLLSGLRGLGALGARAAAFAQGQMRLFDAQAHQRLWAETVGGVSQILTAAMRSAVLLVGGWLVIRGDWPIGSLVAFLAYAGMMSGPLRNLLGLYHAQARAQVALARLGAMIDDEADPTRGADCPMHPREIRLVEAVTRWGRHAPVSARLTAGAQVLVDGPSGIGKSALMACLTGEAPLACGTVLIDGRPASEFSPESRRSAVQHLPQRPCLLRGTLAENLRAGNPEATEAECWRALAICGLADWAQGAQGLATPVAETGSTLSGGMRQRIALARVLLRPAGVLIFDESFSEIDAPTVRRILAGLAVARPDALRVFIAHSGSVREGAFDAVIQLGPCAPDRDHPETTRAVDHAVGG